MTRKEAKIQSAGKMRQEEQTVHQTEKNDLPFVADLRAPEIAVPARPTGYIFKFWKDKQF